MKKKWFLLVLGVMMLVACGNETKSGFEDELAFLDVNLSINPETAQLGETVKFEAKVTYGDKVVTDADEVKFEIWKSQSQEHDKIVVEHNKDGIYSLDKTFNEEGTYYIYAHVTAEGMHSMPKKEFVIGQPSEPETKENITNEMKETEEDHSSSTH